MALRRLRINECPFVCSDLRVASNSVCERFRINLQTVVDNGERLTRLHGLIEGPVLQAWQVFDENNKTRFATEGPKDAEAALYDGFVNDADRARAHDFESRL